MPCLIQIGDLLITIVMGNQYEVDKLNKPNSPNYTSKFKDSHLMQCIYMFCMKASLNVSISSRKVPCMKSFLPVNTDLSPGICKEII